MSPPSHAAHLVPTAKFNLTADLQAAFQAAFSCLCDAGSLRLCLVDGDVAGLVRSIEANAISLEEHAGIIRAVSHELSAVNTAVIHFGGIVAPHAHGASVLYLESVLKKIWRTVVDAQTQQTGVPWSPVIELEGAQVAPENLVKAMFAIVTPQYANCAKLIPEHFEAVQAAFRDDPFPNGDELVAAIQQEAAKVAVKRQSQPDATAFRAPDTIVSLGDRVYRIGETSQMVNDTEDNVLQAFLGDAKRPAVFRLPEPDLISRSSVNEPLSDCPLSHFGVRWLDTALDVWMRLAGFLSKHPKRCPATALQNRLMEQTLKVLRALQKKYGELFNPALFPPLNKRDGWGVRIFRDAQ